MQHPDNLVWIDLEMTGLDSQRDHILEIATLITDAQLNILAEGPVIAIHQPAAILDNLDDWNRQHHGKSGLLERCRHSTISTAASFSATGKRLSSARKIATATYTATTGTTYTA